MPRISRELVAAREDFTIRNFQAGMTIDMAQAALHSTYKMKMNPYRLKELYDQVQAGTANVTQPAEVQEVKVEEKKPMVTSKSIMDRPAEVISEEGPFLTIPELIKKIEKGEI